MTININGIVQHWATKLTTAVTALTALLQPEALGIVGNYLWVHIGEVFTITSLAGFTVAPNIAQIPEDPLMIVAIGTGVAWGGKKLYEMGTELSDKLNP